MTCVGTGPNYYRTFDGLEYTFDGRCEYTAYMDPIRSVNVRMVDCNTFSLCKKARECGLCLAYNCSSYYIHIFYTRAPILSERRCRFDKVRYNLFQTGISVQTKIKAQSKRLSIIASLCFHLLTMHCGVLPQLHLSRA